jgi:hypothetical protein
VALLSLKLETDQLMNIIISGTEKFQDYHTFMRAVIVAIDESLKPDDNKINLYSVGGYKTNQFTAEFVNRSERYLKQKGIKPRYYIVPKKDVTEKFDNYEVDMLLYLSDKKENLEIFDSLVTAAQNRDIDVRIYKV